MGLDSEAVQKIMDFVGSVVGSMEGEARYATIHEVVRKLEEMEDTRMEQEAGKEYELSESDAEMENFMANEWENTGFHRSE